MKKMIYCASALVLYFALSSCSKNNSKEAQVDYGQSPRTPIPADLISPTNYWQFGVLSSTNFYDTYNSQYKDGAGGTYLFYHFNADGTFTSLLYLKATSSSGETRQSWTETKGTVVVGDTTFSNNVTYKTIKLYPTTGTDRWVINYGAETRKALTKADFQSRDLLTAYFVCERFTNNYGEVCMDMLQIRQPSNVLFSFHEEK